MSEFLLYKDTNVVIKPLIPVKEGSSTNVYKILAPNKLIDLKYDEFDNLFIRIGKRAGIYKEMKLIAFDINDGSKLQLGIIKDLLHQNDVGFLLVVDNGKKTTIGN